MGRIESIVSWAESQPEWVSDALRRHASSPQHQLGEADKLAVEHSVRHAADFSIVPEPILEPISHGHLGAKANDSRRALLASLGPVTNLARLLPDQQLSFALDGITLIYGDNGSGKSGYCRITKKLGRSLSVDDLLGNIFEPGAKPPAQVLVRYMYEGDEKATEVTWSDGEQPPEALRGMSVFDSRNARLYVDKENRIGFLPSEFSLLERHGAHRREMDAKFTQERNALDRRIAVPLPSGFTRGGSAELLVARLRRNYDDLPSVEELESASIWTVEMAVELGRLQASLTEDPAILEARLVRMVSTLTRLLSDVRSLETTLSNDVLDQLRARLDALAAAGEAVLLAAHEAFGDDPLPGAGNEPWRLLYDSAREFVASIGLGAELPSDPGDPCALCQQPLSNDASARFHRFQHFVADRASEVQGQRQHELRALRSNIADAYVPDRASTELALAEFRASAPSREAIADQVVGFIESASSRKRALLNLADGQDGIEVPPLALSPVTKLEKEAASLENDLVDLRAAIAADVVRPKLVARINELTDAQLLSNSKATILARLADLETYAKLGQCSTLVGTMPLSTFMTSLRREAVTKDLAERIRGEIEGLELAHIPFEVSDRSRDGQSYFAVGLEAPIAAPNDKILSEGEQRALALACFLAEVDGDQSKNALVIDDPVSSLDHIRIRRVAERLVRVASEGKQVVVFTHNLLFYNEVLTAAGAASIPVARRVISKSQGGFGIVSTDAEPWSTRKVTTRIGDMRARLTQLSKQPPVDQEQYRRLVKDFYTDLRETWERLVEELLLGKVVERYSPDVRTQSLKGVVVEDKDYKTVYFAMARASERSGHDQPAGKQIGVPTVDDMKADLKALDDYRISITERRKRVEESRKKLETPPAARTA